MLEDVRMGFLDQLTWYLDNPEQRAKTFSELYRPNPVNLELQTRIKSLEHDLSCYCNELLDWSKASSTLEQFTGENSHDSSFVPEERAKKISVHLSNPYQPQLTKLVKEATVSLDINFTELLEICRTILKYKDETAETIKVSFMDLFICYDKYELFIEFEQMDLSLFLCGTCGCGQS